MRNLLEAVAWLIGFAIRWMAAAIFIVGYCALVLAVIAGIVIGAGYMLRLGWNAAR